METNVRRTVRFKQFFNLTNSRGAIRAMKFNNINQTINDKNIELQNTVDELTRAKVGRKAATLTLLFVIFLFVISEGVIDPIIDSNTNGNTWLSMVYKAVIALLLKPLEGFLEKYLMKTAVKKRVVTLK